MIHFSRTLFAVLALGVTVHGAFAATTPAKTPKAKTPPPAAPALAAPAPAPTPAPPTPPPAPAVLGVKLDDYISDLATTLKLSDTEKKQIENLYLADGDPMKTVLNNDALSPLQKAQQVADLRTARNTKIEALLQDGDQQAAFQQLEAKYRVALTESAWNGGWVAAPPAPAPAAPAPSAPTAK